MPNKETSSLIDRKKVKDSFARWVELHKFYLYNDYHTRELAKYLKVTPRTIQRWMTGRWEPNEDHLRAIAEYLRLKKV